MSFSTKLETIRERARNDSYFFCKEILGYEQMADLPHKELCEFMLNWNKRKKLILLPRGSFKSSIITIGHTLHALAYNPDLRIMIASENYQNSTKYLGEIKDHITSNKKFKAIYGDLKPSNIGHWKRDEIKIATKTKVGGKEPSIQTSSVGQTRVGMHYDLCILDDPVSNNTVNTIDQINKTIEYYRYLLAVMDPQAQMVIVGTRYHFGDLYGYILEEEKDNFDMLIRGATNSDGSLYFPTRLTQEFLDEQRRSQGSWIFSCQYLNRPVDSDSAVFKKEWINYFEVPPKALNYFIVIDPAGTTGRESDYTAILVIGIDCDSNIFVLENHQIKLTQSDWMDLVFKKCMQYDIGLNGGAVSLETNALQKTYKYAFDLEMEKRKFWFPIVEARPNASSRSKEARISALQPFFEQGKIFLKKEMYSLIDQILRFPKAKNDDQLDALKDILPIMYPAQADQEKPLYETKKGLTQNERDVWKGLQTYTKRKVKRTKFRI